jgi:transmembrane sensor
MISNEEQVRAAIAEQAGEWFVVNDEGPLQTQDSVALADWLKTSPVHVEEFLGVSIVARDLRKLGTDPEFSLDAVLASVQSEEDDTSIRPLRPQVIAPVWGVSSRRWLTAAVTVAALAVLSLGLFWLWDVGTTAHVSAPAGTVALHFETRHGQQLTRRLSDNSVVHLNTDSAVTIRYGKAERLVTLTAGQADFEVAHNPNRPFRVLAGSAEVVAIGTQFDVRLEHDSTLVTVVEGRVTVGPSPILENAGTGSRQNHSARFVQVNANEQVRVAAGEWPATPTSIDAQRTTAWLHRQIVFDQEPLERVAAEFNRYAPTPIEIVTPGLRNLEISGVFATDDTEAFVAFLRSVKGVRLEVTTTRIRVLRDPGMAAPEYP